VEEAETCLNFLFGGILALSNFKRKEFPKIVACEVRLFYAGFLQADFLQDIPAALHPQGFPAIFPDDKMTT